MPLYANLQAPLFAQAPLFPQRDIIPTGSHFTVGWAIPADADHCSSVPHGRPPILRVYFGGADGLRMILSAA
jgi:hypothetical protein